MTIVKVLNGFKQADFSILWNSAFLIAIQLGSFIVPLITFPYLTRTLGAQAYGELAIAFGITTYLAVFTDWGFNLSSTRRIAQAAGDKEMVSKIFWATIGAKSLLAIISLALILTGITFFGFMNQISGVLLATWLAVPGAVLQPNWLFQGLNRLAIFALISLLSRIATIPLIFWLIKAPSDVVLAGFIQASSGIVSAIMSILLVYKLGIVQRVNVTLGDVRSEILDGWSLFVSTFAASLYTTTSTVILGLTAGPIAAGNYAAADRIKSAALALISSFPQVVYPQTARTMKIDLDRGLRLAGRFLVFQAIGTFAVSFVLCMFAPQIMRFAAGADFIQSVAVMRILAWLPFVVSFSNVFGHHVMLPLGMDKIFSRGIVCASLFNLIVIIPLTWKFQAIGAATAIVLTEGLISVMFALVLIYKKIPFLLFKISL